MQQSKEEDKQYNSQKRKTNNTTVKRNKRTLATNNWPQKITQRINDRGNTNKAQTCLLTRVFLEVITIKW